MGPPRLTVVESNREKPDNENAASPPGLAANDSSPVEPVDAATDDAAVHATSPVHDLIQSLETQSGAMSVLTAERREKLRILEAVIFASTEPLDEERLSVHLKSGDELPALLGELQAEYSKRGVNLVKVAGKWTFRTAEDLAWALERHTQQERRLSKAALETLSIVAYHQPVTRAEIEEVRGVSISKGTLDVLMEAGWVRPRGRRRAPGKPITYGTTDRFLEHFGLGAIKDLPGLGDLKAAGLLDANLPPDFKMPDPTDVAALMPDELPLDAGGEDDEPLQAELELPEPDAEDPEPSDEDDDVQASD